MSLRTLRLFTLVALLSVMSLGSANAAITFDLFIRTSVFDGFDNTFELRPSESIDGTIVLRETVTDGTESLLAAANLNAAGVRVSATGSDGTFENLVTDTEGGFAPNNTPDTLTFGALGGGFSQPGKPPVDLGGGIREITLGGLTLNGPSTGETTFALNDINPTATGDFTTFQAVLDSGEFNYRSVTITAIPEPTSALMLLGAGSMVYLRRRRR